MKSSRLKWCEDALDCSRTMQGCQEAKCTSTKVGPEKAGGTHSTALLQIRIMSDHDDTHLDWLVKD